MHSPTSPLSECYNLHPDDPHSPGCEPHHHDKEQQQQQQTQQQQQQQLVPASHMSIAAATNLEYASAMEQQQAPPATKQKPAVAAGSRHPKGRLSRFLRSLVCCAAPAPQPPSLDPAAGTSTEEPVAWKQYHHHPLPHPSNHVAVPRRRSHPHDVSSRCSLDFFDACSHVSAAEGDADRAWLCNSDANHHREAERSHREGDGNHDEADGNHREGDGNHHEAGALSLLPPGSPTSPLVSPRAAPAEPPQQAGRAATLVKEPKVALPAWVPPKPLVFLDPSTRYVPVPKLIGLAGTFTKVPELSTPNPLPIDTVIKANFIAKRAHESITGMKVVETPEQLFIKIRVLVWGVAHMYTEIFNKDGSSTTSSLRRDVRPGKSVAHMYYTECGQVVFVTESINLMGHVDFHGEEMVQVTPDASTLKFTQYCLALADNKTATQFFTGRRTQ